MDAKLESNSEQTTAPGLSNSGEQADQDAPLFALAAADPHSIKTADPVSKAENDTVAIPYLPARPGPWFLIITCVCPTLWLAWLLTFSPNPGAAVFLIAIWFWLVNWVGPLFYPTILWLRRHIILSALFTVALIFWQPWTLYLLSTSAVLWWPAWAVLQYRSYFDYKIALNRKGIRLPLKTLAFPYWNSSIPWEKIIWIDCLLGKQQDGGDFDPDSDPFKNYSLAIKSYTQGMRTLELKHLNASQRSQLFAAIDRWARTKTISNELAVLIQNTPKSLETGHAPQSFTRTWEDDLKSHLNATIYVPLDVGQKITQYTISKHLASGGQATTYLATDKNGKTVVLKEYVLPHETEVGARGQVTEMFKREYQLLKQCEHPRIAKVCDQFTDGDRNYLVLEHITGDNARKRIQLYGVLPDNEVISIALQLADILAYLHTATPPILHRDLSPDNMIIDATMTVFLIDFGAANELLSNATGTAIGKQAYVAPEQFKGKACEASDVYSLGCCMYYLLTAKDPSPLSVSHPRLLNPAVKPELDDLIARCTAQDLLMNRVLTANDLSRELTTFAKTPWPFTSENPR
jgi:tRNA A-37 threonylcarbamoyl transferase component Bud32